MRKICCLLQIGFALLVAAPLAWSVPASPEPFTVQQPNGVALQLRMRGDEWFSWQETLDGHPVLWDATSGFWVYARQLSTGQLVSTGSRVGVDVPPVAPFTVQPNSTYVKLAVNNRSVASQPTAVHNGTGLLPVILANFADTKPTIPAGTFSNLLFSTTPGAKSMANYYRQVSYGKFTVAPGPSGIANWVSVPYTRAYYGSNSSTIKDLNAALFIRDAVQAAIAAGYDFSPYDQDGDGKVDVVNIVHTGAGEEAGAGANAIWSHRFSLSAAGLQPVTTPTGLVVDDYVVQPELRGNGSTGLPINVGVFVHEYGHALGLPDLYDTDYSSCGVGNWSGMSFGANLDGGATPALFDAWCKMKLGWLSPINYTLNYQNVSFPYAADTPFAARLWKDGVASPQYFLVENRYRTNFDAFLPGNGLLIWHIDETKTGNTTEWYPISAGGAPANTNSGNFLVALVQADGLFQLDITNQNPSLPITALQNQGDAGDPFPGTSNNRLFDANSNPNSRAYNSGLKPGYNTYVAVSNISDAGLVMTADLYTRSPNSGPYVEWVNVGGVVPPLDGSLFSTLDATHPVVVKALPGVNGTALKQIQLYINRAQDGQWWNFAAQAWGTNAISSNVDLNSVQQNGVTLAYQNNLPSGTNLLNGGYTFIVRVINTSDIVTELQLAMTAVHRPDVSLSLVDNAIVNTLTNFTALATENSGIGIQRVEVALFYDTAPSDVGPGARWFWNGYNWTTTPMWLGADFPTHPAQATLFYPIGPDAASLVSDHEYYVMARAIDALGTAATNQVTLFYDTGALPTYYWRYSSSGSWSDPANWTPYGLPGPNDHVAINARGEYTVTINGNLTIASLRFGRISGLDKQHLVIASGSLTLGGSETNKIFSTATLDQTGYLTANQLRFYPGASWTWWSGTLNGRVDLNVNATLTLDGQADKTLGSTTLQNRGAIYWKGTGNLVAWNPARIDNLGYFEVQNDQVFLDGNYYDYASPVLFNAGVFRKTSGGTNATVFAPDNQGVIFTNIGLIQVDAGALSLRSQTQLADGGTFSGTGRMAQEGGTMTLSGASTIAAGSSVVVAGATVDGLGAFGGPGALVLSNAAALSGNLTILNGGTLRFQADDYVFLRWDSTLNNLGTIIWQGNGDIRGSRNLLLNQGTFLARNLSGQFIDPDYYDYVPMQFINTGVFRRDVAGTNSFASDNQGSRFHNCGTVDIQAGTVNFNGGGSSTNGLFSPGPNGTIQFAGMDHYLYAGSHFDVSGQLKILAGSVTQFGVTHTLRAGGSFELANGTFDGQGAVGGPGTFVWSGGTIGGINTILTNGSMSITGTATKYLARSSLLANAGTVTWTSSGDIAGSKESVFRNLGLFDAQNNQAFTDYDYYDYAGATFENLGTLRKSASTGLTVFLPDNQGFTLTNAGLIDVQSGVLSLRSGTQLGPGGSFSGPGLTSQDANAVTIYGTNTVLAGGRFQLTYATLQGSGAFGGPGSLVWTNQAYLAGELTLLPGGTLELAASDAVQLNRGSTLNNGGTVLWRGTGDIRASQSLFRNTGLFLARSSGRLYDGDYYDYVPADFINFGIFRKDVPGTNEFGVDNQGFRFHNCGTVEVQSGELDFSGGGSSTNGVFSATAGGRVQFSGRDHYLRGGSHFDVSGSLRITAGSVTQDGVTHTARAGGTIELAGGTLDGTGALGGDGTILWTGGTLGGTNTILPGAIMSIAGVGAKTIGADSLLLNNGTIVWTDSGGIAGNGRAAIQNNQLFEARNDAAMYDAFYYDYVGCTFVNNGTFKKTSSTGTTRLASDSQGFAFLNNGVVAPESGTIQFESGLTLATNSLLQFVLNGNVANTNYGRVNYTGTLPLGGQLAVTYTNGFLPADGSSFPLVTYAARTGQFTGLQLPALGKGLEWHTDYLPNAFTLSVHPTTVVGGTIVSNNQFGVSFAAGPASMAILEASTNLVYWEPVQTNAPFTGTGAFQELMNHHERFYRLRLVP